AAAHIHHRHPAGKWMLEYRMMRMDMAGLLDGTDRVATDIVSGASPGMPPLPDPARSYRMAPTDMTMDMHMLMLMASAGERLTLSLAITIPTGDIDQHVDTSMRGGGMEIRRRLKAGYPMQLGSGTWNLVPSFTYAYHGDGVGVGLQASYSGCIGRNDNGYALGDAIEVIGWTKHAIDRRLLGTLKVSFRDWGRIEGRDPELDSTLAPTTDPTASGGRRLDLGFGFNAFFGNGHSLGIEFGVPVYQDLNGPQMRLNWLLSFSYQRM
ncbi:MAG: hypothetical protein D6727_12495, partial [Gammaproteobacteria bacterium]